MLSDIEAAHDDITPVPPERRILGPLDLGVLWGDLGVGLLVLVAGALLVPALGLRDALIATVIGSIIGSALLATAGRAGSDLGVPTMVALRGALGVRGSYLASLLNIGQLIGWAGLEMIIMAQAARAISREFFGFDGYYFWLAAAGVIATAFAVGGPVVVVRQFLQRFGVWIVLAATIWLTYRLFSTYDVHTLLDDRGAGGFPNFWQAVDIAVSLPVSWLPLVADYSRFARRTAPAAWATFISYAVANIWFFALGAGYVLVLNANPGTLIGTLVDSLLPLAVGWLFLFVILVDETDNTFADIYSAAVSLQNMVRVSQRLLAIGVGVAAFVLAVSVDLLGYENFLLLIGGVFVSLFGVLLADYFIASGGRYEAAELYRAGGRYWYTGGVNAAGMIAWLAGFVVYTVAAQPPALVDYFSWIADIPVNIDTAIGLDVTALGGTLPSFVVSLALYLVLRPLLAQPRAVAPPEPAPAQT
jgi:putative hydroxymethylpyrimidine transporter CytX